MMKNYFYNKQASGSKAAMCAGFGSKIICAAFAAAALCGCDWVFDPLYVVVEKVAVDQKTLTLTVGETATITADFGSVTDPEKYILMDEASWESGDTAVATTEAVDNGTCKITAVAAGTAVVTVKVSENGKSDQCTVTVLPDNVLDCITDPAFKAYASFCMDNENQARDESLNMIPYPKWDSDGDGKLSWQEAAAVESLFLAQGYEETKVGSLEGIAWFTGLKVLNCDFNELETLDLTKNSALKRLDCNYNQLTELNVNGCTALTDLRCHNNQLEELDVTKNTALTDLYCAYNQLTELDVTQNTALTRLNCYNNQLTKLDVNGCTALTNLYCSNNHLTKLDVNGCAALRWLDCYNNRLTELDASNMADPTSYILGCGQQKNSEGGDQQLTLTLREEQKPRWNNDLGPNSMVGYDSYNTDVILAQ